MAKKFGFSFSWKRAVGLTGARISLAKKTGIPTTKPGFERKLGSIILKLLFGSKY